MICFIFLNQIPSPRSLYYSFKCIELSFLDSKVEFDMLTEKPLAPAGVGGNDNHILGPREGWILNTSPAVPCHCLGVTRGLLAEKNDASPIPDKNNIQLYFRTTYI